MGIETGALMAYAALASAAVGAGTAVYQGEQQKKALKQQTSDAEAARKLQQGELDLARSQMDQSAQAERNKAKNPIAALFGGGRGGAFSASPLPQLDPASLLGGGVQLPGVGFGLARSTLLGR